MIINLKITQKYIHRRSWKNFLAQRLNSTLFKCKANGQGHIDRYGSYESRHTYSLHNKSTFSVDFKSFGQYSIQFQLWQTTKYHKDKGPTQQNPLLLDIFVSPMIGNLFKTLLRAQHLFFGPISLIEPFSRAFLKTYLRLIFICFCLTQGDRGNGPYHV